MSRELRIRPLTGIPELHEGDALGRLVAEAGAPASDEIVVISQKAVSKVEGRVRRLTDVEPGRRARELAERIDKDPALVELVFSESTRRLAAGSLPTRGSTPPTSRRAWSPSSLPTETNPRAGSETRSARPVAPRRGW